MWLVDKLIRYLSESVSEVAVKDLMILSSLLIHQFTDVVAAVKTEKLKRALNDL